VYECEAMVNVEQVAEANPIKQGLKLWVDSMERINIF